VHQTIKTLVVVILATAQIEAIAQTNSSPASEETKQKEVYVPAGTPLVVSNNTRITTKNHQAELGDRFYLTTVYDVTVEGVVAIPRGSAVMAQITWRTGKGVFGKSGKFDFEMRHVDVRGQLIPLAGKFRQSGSGSTAATGGVAIAGMATGVGILGGFFITGKSAEILPGQQFETITASGAAIKIYK
jgi:hypothetical protein